MREKGHIETMQDPRTDALVQQIKQELRQKQSVVQKYA